MNNPPRTQSSLWLNRFAWFTAACTLLLICSGGMVTSKGVGLAVPDWPTTFGYNMFLFPASKWVGGILFEHTHRLLASTVGVLTVILAGWLWAREPRASLRMLGLTAIAAVILQGVLGGLRVTMLKDEIGISHACLAQAFFGLLVIIALLTSSSWLNFVAKSPITRHAQRLRMIALLTTAVIYVQLALGATMRHQHRDLAITDFPTAYGQWLPDSSPVAIAKINVVRDAAGISDVSVGQIWLQMAHRFGALLAAVGTIAFFVVARREKIVWVTKLAIAWVVGVAAQIMLGAWTIWSNKAADVATAHVALGATMLAIGVVICAFCLHLTQRSPLLDFPSRRLGSKPIAV
jgi:cytochrome c oxidase assembly protein subunit 15